ncbi:MAG: hypothetical protein A3I89_03570 [Candidatus Harrisonbacteria bacterium RIFCSPLOWO2_02_FULL_41_11]|uniref:Uncharacterized protein n=1 Tax=Candidatus Harrisonbacteria bacterium RIFCSPHIGHO2_02_FULL_42_16 TaxID=1798404 RepID=A0A1G1ZGM0_9BACT|nr:MAG: hypothetical protein A3B92_02180 [Candidatus Harrisonbacteria bacterium RIFCSPHIGHO2_02_FULL_42_16]OGY65894.1 MAG: hypothetical protein A3I89_03570 [Candidatus Harrisonbacteria bacterium RIFCSPLOWO2_02_FULL_41_11]
MPIILKDKYTVFAFALSAAILIIGFGITYTNLAGTDGLLVIHFDNFRGADFFGAKSAVFGILAMALVTLAINFFLADEFYFKERFLSYLLASVTAIFSILILMAVNVIISVN